LAAAVGLAALNLLETENLADLAMAQGDYLMRELRRMNHPAVVEVRGKGLLIGVEIDPAVASARTVCEALIHEGVLTKDTHHTVVRLAPPLTISKAQIDVAVAALRKVLDGLLGKRKAEVRGLSAALE
jgi:ornithine--oxo-acid transaminase